MTVSLKIIKNDLPKIPDLLRRNVADALNTAALVNESISKQLAPVDTGFLRNSIQQTKEASGDNLQAETSVAAEYAVFVELGTTDSPSQPFMTPGFESAVQGLQADLKNVLK
jgi:HK97 gp10 family phage protein